MIIAGDVEQELIDICRWYLRSSQGSSQTYVPDADHPPGICIRIPADQLLDDALLRSISPGPSIATITEDEVEKRGSFFCYSIVFGEAENLEAIFLKRHNVRARIPKSGLFTTYRNEALEKMDAPAMILSDTIDVLVLPGDNPHSYAWDAQSFENLFKSAEVVNRMVPNWIAEICERYPGIEIDIEEQASIASRRPILRRKWEATWRNRNDLLPDIAAIRSAMEKAHVEEELLFYNGRVKINRANTNDFLSLINNDDFVGPLDGKPYRAQRKRPRTLNRRVRPN